VLWFSVPDREIRSAAGSAAKRVVARAGVADRSSKPRFAFHSSGALLSRELEALRSANIAIASVHPLMTFVSRSRPSLASVPFALEGDASATKQGQRIARDLGGLSFILPARRKTAYHAWATMTSPLLLAYLVTLERAGRVAGLAPNDARRMSLPIVRQTLANYSSLGSKHSFSGPFIRGDVDTVAKHLASLAKQRTTRVVYTALARAALEGLPVKHRSALARLLRD